MSELCIWPWMAALRGIGKQAYGGEEPQKQVLHVTVVLSLMDLHHIPNVARQRRRFASYPDEALACVLDF